MTDHRCDAIEGLRSNAELQVRRRMLKCRIMNENGNFFDPILTAPPRG
jgi:hypothetical protein